MWMARTGAQWRRLPPEYGRWNSVLRRYRRWVETGVFDVLLDTLTELAGRDRSADMIDSTVVRAHHCAAGIKSAFQDLLCILLKQMSEQASTVKAWWMSLLRL